MKPGKYVYHIDNPELFVPCRCFICDKCWRHKDSDRCINAGPFTGYAVQKEPNDLPKKVP